MEVSGESHPKARSHRRSHHPSGRYCILISDDSRHSRATNSPGLARFARQSNEFFILRSSSNAPPSTLHQELSTPFLANKAPSTKNSSIRTKHRATKNARSGESSKSPDPFNFLDMPHQRFLATLVYSSRFGVSHASLMTPAPFFDPTQRRI